MNAGNAFFFLLLASLAYFSLSFYFDNPIDAVVELPLPRDPAYYYYNNNSKIEALPQEQARREYENLLFLNYLLEKENNNNDNNKISSEESKQYIAKYQEENNNKVIPLFSNYQSHLLLKQKNKKEVRTEEDYVEYTTVQALQKKREAVFENRIKKYILNNKNNNYPLLSDFEKEVALTESLLFTNGEENVKHVALYVYAYFHRFYESKNETKKEIWEFLSKKIKTVYPQNHKNNNDDVSAIPIHVIFAEGEKEEPTVSHDNKNKNKNHSILEALYDKTHQHLHAPHALQYLLLALEQKIEIPINNNNNNCQFVYFGFLKKSKRDSLTLLVELKQYQKVPVLLVLTTPNNNVQCTSDIVELQNNNDNNNIFDIKTISVLASGSASPTTGGWLSDNHNQNKNNHNPRKHRSVYHQRVSQSKALKHFRQLLSLENVEKKVFENFHICQNGWENNNNETNHQKIEKIAIGSVCITHIEINKNENNNHNKEEVEEVFPAPSLCRGSFEPPHKNENKNNFSLEEKTLNRRFADQIKSAMFLKHKKGNHTFSFFTPIPHRIRDYMDAYYNAMETIQDYTVMENNNNTNSSVFMYQSQRQAPTEVSVLNCGYYSENNHNMHYNTVLLDRDCKESVFDAYYNDYYQNNKNNERKRNHSIEKAQKVKKDIKNVPLTVRDITCIQQQKENEIIETLQLYFHQNNNNTIPSIVLITGVSGYLHPPLYNHTYPIEEMEKIVHHHNKENNNNENDNDNDFFSNLVPTEAFHKYVIPNNHLNDNKNDKNKNRNISPPEYYTSWLPRQDYYNNENKEDLQKSIHQYVFQNTNGVLLYYFMKDGNSIEGAIDCDES